MPLSDGGDRINDGIDFDVPMFFGGSFGEVFGGVFGMGFGVVFDVVFSDVLTVDLVGGSVTTVVGEVGSSETHMKAVSTKWRLRKRSGTRRIFNEMTLVTESLRERRSSRFTLTTGGAVLRRLPLYS